MSGLGPCKRKLIGKYSFLSSNVLGQGYSGTVCLAKNEETGKFYALKIIEKSILKYQAHKSMILCQIEFLTILKGYPNILSLEQVYNTKKNIYLILELCNTDLKEYIRAKKTIPEPQAIEIIEKIIKGYGSIWRQKIIHRDLKPSNILLQDLEIKIADFGFSMFEKDQKEFQKINVGSPYYMPPQVLANNKYSYQSDIWAIGLIFHEMLTGKIPWTATTEKELYKELTKLDITHIIPSQISQKSKQFLMKTLQLDPLKRMKPQEILQFKFIDQLQSIEDELRISNRSQQNILLQQSLQRSKIYHDPVQNTNTNSDPNLNPNHLNFEKNRKQILIADIKDKKSSDQKENEDIGMTIVEKDHNLAEERMKAKKNQEKLDEVNDLPVLPKKKKRIINRKNSLQTQCEILQFDLINKNNHQISSQTALKKISERTNNFVFHKTSQVIRNNISDEKKESIKANKSQEPQQHKKIENQDSEMKMRSQEIMKKFSKILRSQIHFCRYIFKLLTKIMEKIPNESNLVRQELKEQMGALILVKLKKIQIEEIPDGDIFKEWLETRQCEKIKSILKQYKTRYVMALKDLKIPKEFDGEIFRKYLKRAILGLYKQAFQAYLAEQEKKDKQSKTKVRRKQSQRSTSVEEEEESQIMKMKEEIMILDQLITLRQLQKLDEKYGQEAFEKRSRIESIVEGEPLEYIQKKHIVAISTKLGSLKII